VLPLTDGNATTQDPLGVHRKTLCYPVPIRI